MSTVGGNATATTAGARLAENLRRAVRGPVLEPGDPEFPDATLLWNGLVDTRPLLAVRPADAADVAAAVRVAQDRGVALSVRGGGHNIAGTAVVEDGLVIDLSPLRQVHVDPDARTATVGGGCLLREVDAATQRHGLATPLGFVSEVGVAGLTLGGGFGYLTRRFGWTADNLLEAEVVTADGAIRAVNERDEPELFWALRGAGANFGVTTRFTFALHDVGPTVHGGLIAWPFERAEEVLAAYRALTSQAPRELAVWLIMLRAPAAPFVPPPYHGQRICAMSVCFTGDLADAPHVLRPIHELGDPVVDLLRDQPYVELQSYLDATEPKGDHYYWKTEYASELSDGLLDTWRDLAADCPIPRGQLGLLHLGGALNERQTDDGAVGNRDARFACGAIGMWDAHDPDGAAHQTWVRDAWQRFRRFSTGGNYVNFQTADEDDERIRATYGANFDRLLAAKLRYDPDNVFCSNRNLRTPDR